MSTFFVSPQAEYRASRIMQMLHPHAGFMAATATGNVIANFDGKHLTMFKLERDGTLSKMQDVIIEPANEPPTVEITPV